MRRALALPCLLLAFAPHARASDGGEALRFDPSGMSEPAGKPFSAILFQGAAAGAGWALEASILGSDGAWGAWSAARVESFQNGRFWAKAALGAPAGTIVRFRVRRTGDGPLSLDIYSVELVPASPAGARSAAGRTWALADFPGQAGSSGGGAAQEPPLIRRSEWGAAAPTKPFEPMAPTRITIHHTEGARTTNLQDSIMEMRFMQRFHQAGRGWYDIGYHFVIDGAGRIFEGRPGAVIGAHVSNKNEGNIGISLMGSFQPPKSMVPTKEQLASLEALIRWLVSAYGIPTTEIQGHRDQESTSCPGILLYARLDEIRRAAAAPGVRADAGPLVPLRSAALSQLSRLEGGAP